MKLLVVRDQHDLTAHFNRLAEGRVEDIQSVPVAWDAIGSLVDLNKLVSAQNADFLICAVSLPVDASIEDQKQLRMIVSTLCKCAKQNDVPFLFLSSGSVFSSGKLTYQEHDECEPVQGVGKLYLELENEIIKKVESHFILRSTWLYSGFDNDFLSAVVSSAADKTLIKVNSAGKSCPTAVSDLARVFLAVLLQLDLGAKSWGIYHYVSSDPALGFQFIEAIVAQASQFDESINAKELLFAHDDSVLNAFYFEPVVLSCNKLLDDFGIHQKPWRLMLPVAVKEYFNVEIS